MLSSLRNFRASAAMQTRSAVLWDIAKLCVVILYRRFGTAYRFHIGRVVFDFLILEDGTDRLSRNVGTELPYNSA
jgi:hypothetical protein